MLFTVLIVYNVGFNIVANRRYIATRIKEHEYLVDKGIKTNHYKGGSGTLAKHIYNNLHRFDFNYVEIWQTETNLSKRLFLGKWPTLKRINTIL